MTLAILVGGGWWVKTNPQVVANAFNELTAQFSQIEQSTNSKVATKSKTKTTQKKEHSGSETPIEPIVQDVKLSSHYRYRFDKNVPAAARRVFLDAVAVYNRTKIVQITPDGNAKNQITFAMYHKQMSQNTSNIELGVGGPQITTTTSVTGTTSVNHPTAKLNGDYADAFSDSVAIHELGHALGLDHSDSPMSVMYPENQGRTTLSEADIASLREIYG
ncbi:matrixin family metalloprotease [Levilactobacillus bambusae]|nr:matrixin family metalloprotease [Levilactobacillus bambusae]